MHALSSSQVSSIMLTDPLIRFFKFNLMLNKQNCDTYESHGKKNMDNYTPKNKIKETLLIKLY